MTFWWTKEKLVAEVDRFAEGVAEWCRENPDARGELDAEERREKAQRQMREWARLRQVVGPDEALRRVYGADEEAERDG
jgi:hypothetical protein